jgi:hypothetical protein
VSISLSHSLTHPISHSLTLSLFVSLSFSLSTSTSFLCICFSQVSTTSFFHFYCTSNSLSLSLTYAHPITFTEPLCRLWLRILSRHSWAFLDLWGTTCWGWDSGTLPWPSKIASTGCVTLPILPFSPFLSLLFYPFRSSQFHFSR